MGFEGEKNNKEHERNLSKTRNVLSAPDGARFVFISDTYHDYFSEIDGVNPNPTFFFYIFYVEKNVEKDVEKNVESKSRNKKVWFAVRCGLVSAFTPVFFFTFQLG